jgi:hypothetical protein
VQKIAMQWPWVFGTSFAKIGAVESMLYVWAQMKAPHPFFYILRQIRNKFGIVATIKIF